MTQVSEAFPYSSFIPSYVNGLQISRTSTTVLSVAPGSILDSTGTFQLSLGVAQAITATNTGLNGLDTGTFAASTVYAVYLVADPVTQQATGAMISASFTQPLLPFGYSAFALVGYATTDVSTHFLPGYWSAGIGCPRLFMYDAPQATAVTAGAATTYTAVSLETLVPLAALRPVWIATNFTPNVAGHGLYMQPQEATGDAITILGQVATVHMTNNSLLYANSNSTHMQINYKVTDAADAVAINVAGYEFFI